MKESARRVLEHALSDAVVEPIIELKRKSQYAITAAVILGALLILTATALVQARDRATQLDEARTILADGFTVRPIVRSPYLMSWPLEDGTVMMLNIPLPPEKMISL